MPNTIELYNLEGDFDETLRQYKQAYVNYITILKKTKSNSNSEYTILDNTDSPGNNIYSYRNVSKNTCQAICNANTSCYGFVSTSKNLCFMKNNKALKTQDVRDSTFYIKNKNNADNIIIYNEKLIRLNEKIIKLLKSMQPSIDSVKNKNKEKLVEAQKMYVILLQEKKKIQQLMEQNLTVNTGKGFFETYFHYQYAQYLFWFFLLLIVVLVTATTVFFPDAEIKPLKIIGWALFFAFIVVSALYSYVPAAFLILCLIIAYICLGFLKIVPIP